LKDADILIGKFTGDPADIKGSVTSISAAFEDNCPLWTYVLAETKEVTVTIKTNQGDKPIKTRRLGPVGGRIVAETFIGLMLSDSSSYFNQNPIWAPSKANAQGTVWIARADQDGAFLNEYLRPFAPDLRLRQRAVCGGFRPAGA
jgi:hypothetical protein